MSQPISEDLNDPLNKSIHHEQDLVSIFTMAEKDIGLIGIEYEMFAQKNLSPLPFAGDISITTLFNALSQSKSKYNFTPIYENDHIVALGTNNGVIALEPGGQIEIALKPYDNIINALKNFEDLLKVIHDVAHDLGITLFALGLHPWAQRDEMALVKKARYGIMQQYMSSLPGLGLDMMTRSCAIQFNLDYRHEKDMIKKTRLAAFLSPLLALLSSSSAFIDKKPTTYAIARGNVWRFTDPLRSGIPKIIFDDNFGYDLWINYALDVPMYFIRRQSNYYPVFGASFRHFIKHGLSGFKANHRDFMDHLTTIFTDVRLKPIIELRSPDSLPLPFVKALSALVWVLFYDDEAFNNSYNLGADLSFTEIIELRNNVIDQGRHAELRGQKVFTLIAKLLDIAQPHLDNLSKDNNYITNILDPLRYLIDNNTTIAEQIKHNFTTINENNFSLLINQFNPLKNNIC